MMRDCHRRIFRDTLSLSLTGCPCSGSSTAAVTAKLCAPSLPVCKRTLLLATWIDPAWIHITSAATLTVDSTCTHTHTLLFSPLASPSSVPTVDTSRSTDPSVRYMHHQMVSQPNGLFWPLVVRLAAAAGALLVEQQQQQLQPKCQIESEPSG